MATHRGLIISAGEEENDFIHWTELPSISENEDELFKKKKCQEIVRLVHRPSDFMSEFTCSCNPSTGIAAF